MIKTNLLADLLAHFPSSWIAGRTLFESFLLVECKAFVGAFPYFSPSI